MKIKVYWTSFVIFVFLVLICLKTFRHSFPPKVSSFNEFAPNRCGYFMTVVFQSRKLPSSFSIFISPCTFYTISPAIDANYWWNKVYHQLSVRRLEARTEAERRLKQPTWSSIQFDFETHCVWHKGNGLTLRRNNNNYNIDNVIVSDTMAMVWLWDTLVVDWQMQPMHYEEVVNWWCDYKFWISKWKMTKEPQCHSKNCVFQTFFCCKLWKTVILFSSSNFQIAISCLYSLSFLTTLKFIVKWETTSMKSSLLSSYFHRSSFSSSENCFW